MIDTTHALSADGAYEAIRASNTDITQIAKNTGFKPRSIQKVKDHIFNEPHLLDRYVNLGEPAEFRTFDSDLRIGGAWERLRAGAFTPQDLQLLRHETAEAWYMRKHGPSYTAAHDVAHARFPSPFAASPAS